MRYRKPIGEPDDAWFVCERRTGEIQARPINARGRIALLACILGTNITALGLFRMLVARSTLLAALCGGAALILGLLGIVGLAIAKGRRVR